MSKRAIPRPYAWQLLTTGLVRFGPIPGFDNVEVGPPLPQAAVDAAKQQNRDPVSFYLATWLPMHGDPGSLPEADPIVLPKTLTDAARKVILDDLRKWTPEGDARAAELGFPSLIRKRAQRAGLDVAVYFDREVRPLFENTTTDYEPAVYVDDPAVIQAARDGFSEERANIAHAIGIPLDVIQSAHRFGQDPIRRYNRGDDAETWSDPSKPRKWRPTAYVLSLRAGMPDALPEDERGGSGAEPVDPDSVLTPRSRFLAGKLTAAEIASRSPRARVFVADGDTVPAAS